jgi:hypothetical protein
VIQPVKEEKVKSIRMFRNGIGSKMDQQAKVGKARAKAKGKERKVATATERANLCATIGARGTGNYCRYAAACNFSHDAQGGTKRKREGATSLPAKAVKKAKKEIMAMVIEEMKASEEVPVPRSSVAQASETLLALVRGARQKGATNMLGVVLPDNATDFVPSDPKPKGKAVLMMPRPWMNAQELRPVNRDVSQRKDPSAKDSDEASSCIEKDIKQTENDDLKKKFDKNGSPVNQKSKKETVEK